ncbi:MAG: VOC family protein [Cyclobacteriaceae bacterium]|nr:VOC family protein [Cyclobacteriaceae bacterium]MCH8516832.1 VOC family protein [Cyclobacteriaceae bacterium]
MKLTQVKEICIYGEDLKAMEAFYSEVLDLPVMSRVEGRHVFFRLGMQVLLCFNPKVTAKEEKLPPHWVAGKQHIAFECNEEDYLAWKSKLQAQKIAITHEQEWHEGRESFYFEDPAGNVLEILPPRIWE